jgi:hypothetical protein
VGFQSLCDSFRITVDAVDTGDEISTVSLHEDGILRPVVIFVVSLQERFELGVISALGVEDRASSYQH